MRLLRVRSKLHHRGTAGPAEDAGRLPDNRIVSQRLAREVAVQARKLVLRQHLSGLLVRAALNGSERRAMPRHVSDLGLLLNARVAVVEALG